MSRLADTVFRLASRSLRVSLRQIPLGFSRAVSSSTLPIFIFHAVEENPKPYIKHLYDYHTPESFERVLDEILRNFRPLEDLSPQGIARAGADQFLVTFDDGLRSSYEVAAPILERKGIPSIHFLITDFLAGSSASRVEEKFKASLLKEALSHRSLRDQADVASILAHAGYVGAPEDALMSVRLADGAVYAEVAERLEIDMDAYFRADRPYITHDEAADLARRGFMLGAHSRDHPRYWEIGLDEQVEQTLRSMQHVQTAFGLPHRYFAFPYKNKGITSAFYDRTHDAVDLFFTTSGWGNRMNRQKVFHRVGLDSTGSASQALQSGWRPFPLSLVQ
ncbi:polysaccharide deacetylase family protein [Hydrogenophaga sp. PAMC20947]|uniref:polysaccharide deacetylase family protein n=1 Tax=Hydrogenophaga sp. PAMC20947 TaxID=2565558 RepID=UPI00109E2CBB|nr:polysaccharide deacetylase family protein [Hydrogenophaga sp. PAMC20947]QCB44820.1 hypothetical protein E5678_01450 [Hydrogenophaga sp. PAMC20947]